MASSKPRRSRSPRSRQRSLPSRLMGWLFKGALAFILISVAWVLLYAVVPPPITATQIGDLVNGRQLSRDWMSLAAMDPDMPRAAIAAEDSKFCSHRGFDQDAIAEAMRRNAQGGRIRGGSTISQQTAKNAFLWQGGGYFRKGLEAWFTFLIENIWGKQRIMEVYLNVAETGIGTYGVNAGAQRYFGKDASSLTRQEAARIAAVLPLPKKREAKAPSGFTRRYGNSISARINVVQRDGLDACLRGDGVRMAPQPDEPTQRTKPKARKAAPTPQPERVEDYIDPADQAPVIIEVPAPGGPADEAPAPEAEPPAPANSL